MDEKEARIRFRRERIRRRYDNSPKEPSELSRTDERVTSSNERSKRQIYESLQHLAKVKKDKLDEITRFRINALKKENERRVQEESLRELRYRSTQEYNEGESPEMLREKWDELSQIKNPMPLYDELEKIRGLYSKNLQESDKVVNDLKAKLIEKDEAFITNLRETASHIDQLQVTIDDTKSALGLNYFDELKSIEEALVDDRATTLKSHSDNLGLLIQKKMSSLERNLVEIFNRRNENQKISTQHEDEATKTYNELKTDLYQQVNKIECDLAISRGIYAANSDQIEYNLRATAAKNKESEEKINKKKKRIAQYKEELNKELERSKFSEKQESKRNEVLDDDCSRLEGQFKNLLDKLHRFELVEEQKYYAAETMHQEDIRILMRNINTSKKRVSFDFGISVMSEGEAIGSHRSSSKRVTDANFWSELESMLKEYHELLEGRERLKNNLLSLTQENNELELKLETLQQQEINGDLIVPPIK